MKPLPNVRDWVRGRVWGWDWAATPTAARVWWRIRGRRRVRGRVWTWGMP